MSDKIKLVFLGTGGMIPDEKRNHPAFLISYKGESILVDCGEGTQTQFRKAKLNPCKITQILITHWHGDHTFGLPGLLRTLSTSGYKKKLRIYGPFGIKKHIKEMFIAFGEPDGFKVEVKEVFGKFFETNDFYLEAEKMVHVQPCNSYSFILKGNIRIDKKKIKRFKIAEGKHFVDLKEKGYMVHKGKKYLAKNLTYTEEEKKISFVLDTLYNERVIPFIQNSDILVCEASFSDDLKKLAQEYKHLTSKQVAEIAKKGKIKKLILTHLSQRYSKNSDKILNEARKIFKNTTLAKDLDVIEL